MDDIVKRIRQQSYFGLEPYEAANEIEQLRQRVAELESKLRVKEATIGQMANDAQKLTAERDALKKLYESSEESVLVLKETRNRLAEERDKAAQYWQIAEGRCDALMKQRDDLLAALEAVMTMDVKGHQFQDRLQFSTSGRALLDQCNAAIASVKEKQNDSNQ